MYMDYGIISLVVLTILVGVVSSLAVYVYMKIDRYLNDIHHRIDNEINHINYDIESVRKNIIDSSNEHINRMISEINILDERIDEIHQQQRIINSKIEKIQNDKMILND